MLDLELIPDLMCGRTNREPRVEEITRALREQQGFRLDGGCGRPMSFLAGYRCAECGRWMHLACLKAHFTESSHDVCVMSHPAVEQLEA